MPAHPKKKEKAVLLIRAESDFDEYFWREYVDFLVERDSDDFDDLDQYLFLTISSRAACQLLILSLTVLDISSCLL